MSSHNRRSADVRAKRTWPAQALALFLLIIVAVYAIVFFTGDRSASPKLGIDLQGGTRVTLVPQGEDPTPEQLADARNIIEQRVNGMGVSGASVVVDGNTLVITAAGDDTSAVRNLGQTSQLAFRPVIQSPAPDPTVVGDVLVQTADDWVAHGIVPKEDAQTTVDSIATQLGAEEGSLQVTAEPLEEPVGPVASAERRAETTDMLRSTRQSTDPTQQFASLALMSVVCPAQQTDPLAGSDDLSQPLVACDATSKQPLLLGEAPLLSPDDPNGPRLTGNEIDTTRPITGGFNPQTSQMEISFAFSQDGNPNGSQAWAQLTSDMIGQQVAITLDSQVISAPVIQGATPVGSATSITGSFTQEEATSLANNLRYGALPLSFVGEDGEPGGTATTVPPSLGAASLKAGLIAGIVGLILVAVFVFAYYRLFGLISLATLVLAGAVVYGLLVLLGRWIGYSLDLSGVAGLIIGIGTTADSFVVIYERVKDELRKGRTFRSATAQGWDRAKETIVTGNIVTLIGAVVIYFLAIGDVKGFAFTMGLTTVVDLLVTFLVTAPLMILASRSRFWSRPAVNGMGKIYRLVERERAATSAPAAGTETEEK
ncbi:protein translocase subunit SecD [Corynebacterium sanguinis]|uniref:protein translocase subunit SecD n=1 Tax=Corynebacterium sanguinis TaxID=2594913 RepID=UPI0021AFE11D|nr:protein translocase subunit SecD [Corynebacterium sanguinis]MCT1411076.1 protein translocase subunit SecD [Corynebacterium sanguinis]MCT1444039.1 protein translocase subunit SecD [Corynebacterium sanguinis]MCT1492283.1 protein translocase subunit SecD [Corynebacterium sanguinis]MCT1596594.1 protein translocase subunit SecD [Corynebacterium sanguinis]MCT1695118.1 protein translocase subunit SecD [Corynebacterium sanguinis]